MSSTTPPIPPTASVGDGPRRPRLVIVGGRDGVVSHELPPRGAVVIGRDPGCDLRLDEPSLSRRHARIEIGDDLRIVDLDSRHGVVVRGSRIAPATAIRIAPDEAVGLGALTVLVQRRTLPDRPIWGRGYFDLRLAEACADAARDGRAVIVARVRGAGQPEVAARLVEAVSADALVATTGADEWTALAADDGWVEAARRALAPAPIAIARWPEDGRDPSSLSAALAAQLDAAPPGPRRALSTAGPMRAVVTLLDRIAPGDISVLIVGETGVGKEVVAEHLHARSRRAAAPLLRLNCAALPEHLLESELFGHERGAFTGAATAKPGLLEQCVGGTVLLDEIGELPAAIQVKLLRVLEERALLRVGALKPRPIDVRFVAATHRDLEAAVATGSFREDLYYRLAGVTVAVPPLRERGEELPLLAAGFVAATARALGRSVPIVSPAALARLRDHRWPGNVRELRNVMERATLLCDGAIGPEHLGLELARPAASTATATAPPLAPPTATGGLDDVRAANAERERRAIADALAQTGGDQGRAAALLGIARRTLTNKLTRYGFARPRKR